MSFNIRRRLVIGFFTIVLAAFQLRITRRESIEY